MTDVPEKLQATTAAAAAAAAENTTTAAPTSPARSDKSSDSEGKNVREKLKDTQIDAQATSDPAPASDRLMNDAPNGSAKTGEHSASGSDSERGRLRRKRSREDFEEEAEADKHPEKKVERHARKRSRDITADLEAGVPGKPSPSTISSIQENDGDEQMTSPNKNTSTTTTAEKASVAGTSPKNKRTRDQVEKDTEASAEASDASANGKPVEKSAGDERDTKRLRDKEEVHPTTDATESKAKVRRLTLRDYSQLTLKPDPTRQWVCQHFRRITLCRYSSETSAIQDFR
jgi:Ran-binding protein 3